MIVFQDEGTPFCPTMIKSKLLHVFVIVQPIMKDGETDSYQVILFYNLNYKIH